MMRWRSNLRNIQKGTYLYADGEGDEIYKRFRQFFRAEKNNDYVWRYVIKKEPSDELIKAILEYDQKIENENKQYYEYIDTIAKDVYDQLSDEDKQYIFTHPDSTEHHFGMGLGIRNHYGLWGNEQDFLRHIHPDDISSDITERVAAYVIEGYDYYNPFYRHLYGNFQFSYLRRLYYALIGKYPDEMMKEYAEWPDDYLASKQVLKIVEGTVVDKERFEKLCKDYSISEEHRSEMEQYVDEYNEKNWDIIPYDIGLLECKKLNSDFRMRLIGLLKVILDDHPRHALTMPAFIFNQKDVVLLAVSVFGITLKRFPGFSKDDEVIRCALKDSGKAIQYVHKDIRFKKEYMKLAFSSVDDCPLEMRCMAKYRDSDEWVKRALTANGEHMEYASQRIRDDVDMAIYAIKHNRNNSGDGPMEYLSRRLRDNRDLVLLDIKVGNANVSAYSARLRDSDEIAEALLKTKNKWKIYQMSKRIWKKYDKE